jgi:hypothetical protein
MEDVAFDPAAVRARGVMARDEFWVVLESRSRRTLAEIFGPTLERTGRTASMAEGTGARSLGVLDLGHRVRLEASFGKLKVALLDSDLGTLRVPVTDLRLHDPETGGIHERRLELVNDRLRRRRAILSVGVGRAWAPDGEEPRHWLQVNNIHLDDNPLWP